PAEMTIADHTGGGTPYVVIAPYGHLSRSSPSVTLPLTMVSSGQLTEPNSAIHLGFGGTATKETDPEGFGNGDYDVDTSYPGYVSQWGGEYYVVTPYFFANTATQGQGTETIDVSLQVGTGYTVGVWNTASFLIVDDNDPPPPPTTPLPTVSVKAIDG